MSKSASSITDVLDSVIGIPASTNDPSHAQPFIASPKFTGSKPGYVYRAGDQGLGYYLDSHSAISSRSSIGEPDKKRAKPNGESKPSVRFNSNTETRSIPSRRQPVSGQELLAQAEEEALTSSSSTKLFDPSQPHSAASFASSLLKTHAKNTLLRAQHGHDAEKYMMNEVQLNDELLQFKNAAVDTSCYEMLVEKGVMGVFGRCMEHENTDVCISVLGVLVELLDPNLLSENEGGGDNSIEETRNKRVYNVGLLADAFVAEAGLDAIANNLGRFDESMEEEAKGVEDALTLVESLLDLDRAGVLYSGQTSNDDDERKRSSDKSVASVVSAVCKTGLLSWLFQRIEKNDTSNDDSNSMAANNPISPAVIRLHASEVLSTILQHEDYCTKKCGAKLASLPEYTSLFDENEETTEKASSDIPKEHEQKCVDGMEILLLAIAAYRKSDPKVEVECEFLENIFDALAASLLRSDNVADFVEKEGIQLMLRCVREKVHSGGGALKVLNFAFSGSSQADMDNNDGSVSSSGASNDDIYKNACEIFVHTGGLKLLFPLYMARKSAIPCPAACSEGGSDLAKKAMTTKSGVSKRAKRAAHARKKWLAEVEQNVVNIMYALTRFIHEQSKYDSYSRLLAKFVEEECEKCDRTIELCLKYDEKARIAEYQYFKSDEAEDAEELGLDLDVAALSAKLRGGGDIFHRLCAILSFVCVGSTRSHGHVREQLKLQGASITVIKEGLAEFASLLVDGSQKTQIEHYLASI
jgi:beta-catenin-like protein 1